jgi:hypothetical protein
LSTQALTWRTGRPLIVVMIAAVIALFATSFGGNWIVRADEHSGTNPNTLPNTLPGTIPPDPQPDAPASPEVAIAVAGDGEVGVEWAAPRTGEPGDVQSYAVTSAPDSGEHAVDAPVRHLVVNGLTNGVEYVFYVVAIGPGGISDPTTINSVTPDQGEAFGSELLEKLERHLQEKLNKAHGNFQQARGKAF